MVGSICSNQYSDGSDVDVHFSKDGFGPSGADDFNRLFRAAFAERFPGLELGGHPVEVFFQPNPFQDLMSAGCYDVASGGWEAGPRLEDPSADPVAEYYEDDMRYAGRLAADVRSLVMEVYEKALVLGAAEDEAFFDREFESFASLLSEAASLYAAARAKRKAVSSPRSREEALRLRSDRRWRVADSAFKLFDRFGYLAALKGYSDASGRLSSGEISPDEAVTAAKEAFLGAVGKARELNDSEEEVDEGVRSALGAAALAALALAPGFASGVQKPADACSAKPGVAGRAEAERKIAGLSESNLVNLLATIAYNETMTDWLRKGDDDEIVAVLNTVQNRAGGDPENFAREIRRPSQYFSAKKVKGGYDDRTYVAYTPAAEAKASGGRISPRQQKCWEACVRYARQAVDGTLKNVIGDRNMIANDRLDTDRSATKPGGWGERCDLEVGGQRFGYDGTWDGYARYRKAKPASLNHAPAAKKAAEYVVKAGDTLYSIAKAHGTTVERLKARNGLKDANVIRAGQKLTV